MDLGWLVCWAKRRPYIYIYIRIYYVDTTVYIVKGSTVLWGNVPLRPASCIWHHLAARPRHKLSSSRIHDMKDPLHAQVNKTQTIDNFGWPMDGITKHQQPCQNGLLSVRWLRFHVVSGDMAHLHDTSLCMSVCPVPSSLSSHALNNPQECQPCQLP